MPEPSTFTLIAHRDTVKENFPPIVVAMLTVPCECEQRHIGLVLTVDAAMMDMAANLGPKGDLTRAQALAALVMDRVVSNLQTMLTESFGEELVELVMKQIADRIDAEDKAEGRSSN